MRVIHDVVTETETQLYKDEQIDRVILKKKRDEQWIMHDGKRDG